MLEIQKLWVNRPATDILVDMEKKKDREDFEKLKQRMQIRDFIPVYNHDIIGRRNKYCGWICVITRDTFNDYWFWYIHEGVEHWVKKLEGPTYFVSDNIVCYNRQEHSVDVLSLDDIDPEKYLTDKDYADTTNRDFLFRYPVPTDVSVIDFCAERICGDDGEVEIFAFFKTFLSAKVFRLPITVDKESRAGFHSHENEKLEMTFEEDIPDFAEMMGLTSTHAPRNIIFIFKNRYRMTSARVYRPVPSPK